MLQETYQETSLSNVKMCFQEKAVSNARFFSGESDLNRGMRFQETAISPARTFL